jgi:hypothetical protein
MMRPTHVYVVCSPRPRTGKTLLSRVIAEFYRTDGRSVSAFDLDTVDAGLSQFLGRFATQADITDIRGQMALFDQLIVPDERPKVVDVSAAAFEPFFNVMSRIDFVGEARRRSVIPMVLFAASPDQRAIQSYATLSQHFPDLSVIPVQNDAIVRNTYLGDDYRATSATALPIRIPALSPSLRLMVETPPFSFAQFRRRTPPDMPPIIEDELNSWLKRVFLQFRELELRLLMSSLSVSLQTQLKTPPAEAS